jgi:uncharacterized membrane protein
VKGPLRAACATAAAGIATAAVVLPTAGVIAAAGLAVTTPYPSIEVQPGSSVKVEVDVSSRAVEPVDLNLAGLPDGWRATMRGGGFVIHAVTTKADEPATAELEIDVPPGASPGSYPITITGRDGAEASTATVTFDVAREVNSGIGVTADFPSLTGEPGTAFTYNLTITNNTPASQTFAFDPSGPQGWQVTASPSAEERAQTVTVDAGATTDVKVTATPPQSAEQGKYPIDIDVTAGNGARGKISLTAEVTGTPQLSLATADQRLDVSGHTDSEKRVPMVLANGGTAPLEGVKLAGTAPTGWEVSFDPQEVTELKPNETAQVTAIIKPAKDAVAGDYMITVRSSAGSESSNADLRFSLESSRTLGFVAIGVIVAAVLVLVGVFVRFGRR